MGLLDQVAESAKLEKLSTALHCTKPELDALLEDAKRAGYTRHSALRGIGDFLFAVYKAAKHAEQAEE